MSISIFDLELSDLSADQPPAFTNAADCRKWLTEIPFTNARQAQVQLLRQINLLNRFDLPAENAWTSSKHCARRHISCTANARYALPRGRLPLRRRNWRRWRPARCFGRHWNRLNLHCLKSFIDANPSAGRTLDVVVRDARPDGAAGNVSRRFASACQSTGRSSSAASSGGASGNGREVKRTAHSPCTKYVGARNVSRMSRRLRRQVKAVEQIDLAQQFVPAPGGRW